MVQQRSCKKFGEGGFGKRPDTLTYPDDVVELAKQGATSFHISEEHWQNVLQVNPELKRAELDKLRTGWDLIIDVDCQELDYSKITAHLLVQALKYHGLNCLSVKFSGNHGFHIAVPYCAFPEKINNQETNKNFPEGPRRIALYLKDFIKEGLAREMLKKEDINEIAKRSGKPFNEIVVNGIFDPFSVLSIDTVLISSRHLYRSIYSFNEKSGLISIPVDADKIIQFNKEDARPEKIKPEYIEFVKENIVKPNEAKKLIVQAFDYLPIEEKPKETDVREFEALQDAVPEELFPPCIKLILQGLEDGKKRALFILTNFLVSCGWSYDMIEKRILEWNKMNKEPLRETTVRGHLRYNKQQQKKILPPNCQNVMYYTDMRICYPDNFCKYIKNPVNYAIRKSKNMQRQGKNTKKESKNEKKTVIEKKQQ